MTREAGPEVTPGTGEGDQRRRPNHSYAFTIADSPEAGKLKSPSTPGASNDGDINSVCPELRLCVTDRKTRINFLIDSGSVLSILPASKFATGRAKEEHVLYAANSSRISTYGKRTLELDLSLRRPFTVADVATAIIGADLLSYYNLLIDLKGKRLIDSTTGLASDGKVLKTQNINISTINPHQPFRSLLNKYITITRTPQRLTIKPSPFAHRITTTGPPVAARFRKIFGEKASAAKAEIQNLLNSGILRPSSSPWASPIHMV
ncbi:uncharacterized protein LOC113367335 [Ctenocephalides felis]|uniref:uncharacterized protein LOC113367335 n=1 Tax=Ctenocephalides felis TaxID=7515 RepID=UPI000E6E373A|nr:uncharacterized protein LOC113367335 [Ctenocephalides felis]